MSYCNKETTLSYYEIYKLIKKPLSALFLFPILSGLVLERDFLISLTCFTFANH